MLFSSVILLCFISSSIAYIQPAKLRVNRAVRNLSTNNNIDTVKAGKSVEDSELFNPFTGSNFLNELSLASTDASCQIDESREERNEGSSGNIEYIRAIPALSLLAVLGLVGNADAATDAATDAVAAVPLHGVALYSRYFLSGGLCCSLSHGIAVPFDVVKTRLQTSTKGEFESTNVISVARTIVDQDGVGMLYKGLGPTLVGYFIQGSLKYGFYEIFKPLVCGELYHLDLILPDSTQGRVITFMISGFFAEFIGSSFLAPFEAARIRLVTNPTFATGVVDCISKIIKEEQASALFRGLPAVFAKQIPFTVIQLASFESITTAIYNYLSRADNDFDYTTIGQYKYAISGFAALIAAVLSSLASQPGDTLLSAVNQSSKISTSTTTSTGMNMSEKNEKNGKGEKEETYFVDSFSNIEVETKIKKIVKTNVDIVNMKIVDSALESPLVVMKRTVEELGFKGLFKGTKARLLHVSFYVVIQFLIYDFVKQSVGLPVTGVH